MSVQIAESAIIREDVIIGDNVTVGENVFIDHHCIVGNNVSIGDNTRVGAGCIVGESLTKYYGDEINNPPIVIGKNSILRSYTIIYNGCTIGDYFQTGHRVTVREYSEFGHHVRIGTLSDIQGYCKIGNYFNAHSNVHIAQETVIEDYVWIFPYVFIGNDPTPPSYELKGATIKKFAVIAAGSIVIPGVTIGEDALIGAGSVVTKDIAPETIAVGNPAKPRGPVQNVKNHVTGESVYPWRYHFNRGMPWEDIGYEKFEKGLIK